MNEEQIAFWNGPGAQRWTRQQAALDRALQAFARAALDAADAQSGEAVLDVGCGCGDSTIALAHKVGASGLVTGVDVSAPMLARARERLAELRETRPEPSAVLKNVRLLEADAARLADVAAYDLIHSRFGVMFFDEPIAAFAGLRAALRSSGRIAFVCWRTLADNPWAQLPVAAVRDEWSEAPPSGPAETPGPFAFSEHARLTRVMRGGGYSQIQIERFDAPVLMASEGLAQAVEFALSGGPASRLLATASPEVHARVQERVTRLLESARSERGYELQGSCWIVRARA